MAFSENIMEHAKYADGTFTYYAEIICDTEADIPEPAEHPNWEVGSRLIVLENGGSQYRLSNAREWVQVNFNQSGEGGDSGASLLSTSIKVYVNASAGSDENDGLSASKPFATLGHALEATVGYGMTEISMTAGSYDFPDDLYYIFNRDLRITGVGQVKTRLYGKLHVSSSNLELVSLSLNGAKEISTDIALMTIMHGSTVKMENSYAYASTSNNAFYVGTMGHLFLYGTTVYNFSTHMLYMTMDADAVLCAVLCSTSSTSENVMAGGTALLRITDCPDMTYTANYAGIVFVDGVQKSPVDISTLASAAGIDLTALTSTLTLENETE